MSQDTITIYHCDNCNESLQSCISNLNIVTSKSEISTYWKRLHVRIQCVTGCHNKAETKEADLCQNCTIALLKDALSRVIKGERASKGTEEINERGWIPK